MTDLASCARWQNSEWVFGAEVKSECRYAVLEPWLAALLPFYRNMRDDVALPNGSLHALKQEFDTLGKEERDATLARLKQEYWGGCRQ